MSISAEMERVISVLQEPGYIVFQVEGIKMKLPVKGTVSEIHDRSQEFLTELFAIEEVTSVFKKYGVVLDFIEG